MDPVAALDYAAGLMASHLRNYNGNYATALAAYNAGPGAVAQYGGVPPYAETQNYIAKILGVSQLPSTSTDGGGGGSQMPHGEDLLTPQPPPSGGDQSAMQYRPGPPGYIYVYTPPATAFDTSAGWKLVQDRSYRAPSSPNSESGPAWANVGLRQQELNRTTQQQNASLAEQQRQFNERFGMDKAMFNITTDQKERFFNTDDAFRKAVQSWREAVDKRDFEGAEYWKSRAYEMQRSAQTQDAWKTMMGQTGPRDWVKYWHNSRGMTTPRGEESVPVEDAIPFWARPMAHGAEGGKFSVGTSMTAGQGMQPAPNLQQQQPPPKVEVRPQPTKILDLSKTQTLTGAPNLQGPTATTQTPAWATSGATNMPTDAKLADFGGTPISLSNWAVSQLNKAPNWAVK